MKLVSFSRLGRSGFGAIVDGAVIDLSGKLSPDVQTLKEAIEFELLDIARDYCDGRTGDFHLSDITFLPVIPDPGKILCVGLNYKKHQVETGRPDADYPTIFPRYADSQVGHGQALIKPTMTEKFDYEGELAIVIGRGGRCISKESALSHIAGYACYNEGSVRDWQRHTSQFIPGKTFPGTAGFGPWLLTSDEIEDYTTLPIETRLNGKVMQQAMLADLLFPLPDIINYISSFTPLSAGDVIVTGTPGGVGDKREPPVYMQPGDRVEIDCGPVGTLLNTVVAEADLLGH
ncbi:fumarylacetoacetate hydrolase family protein [Granulosicoccus sp.]|nr:fumarylacetoacetate hydrolase family protein [Granulosicoccus sp.]MDB4224510.1 fumarylacetoacetate hydrolase family protein [Granulosicoccus sp.]